MRSFAIRAPGVGNVRHTLAPTLLPEAAADVRRYQISFLKYYSESFAYARDTRTGQAPRRRQNIPYPPPPPCRALKRLGRDV